MTLLFLACFLPKALTLHTHTEIERECVWVGKTEREGERDGESVY